MTFHNLELNYWPKMYILSVTIHCVVICFCPEKYNFLYKKGINIPKEVQKCLIPNCSTMTWKILRQETLSKYGIGRSVLSIVFDSGRKVRYFCYIHNNVGKTRDKFLVFSYII